MFIEKASAIVKFSALGFAVARYHWRHLERDDLLGEPHYSNNKLAQKLFFLAHVNFRISHTGHEWHEGFIALREICDPS